MSAVTVELQGLDELIKQLTDAPQVIRDQGMQIVHEEVEAAATEIAMHYPTRSGTLARRVRAEFPSSAVLIGLVKSLAPHAHLYEFGTKKRENSKHANRGTMPRSTPPVFVPIVQRHRVQMYQRLVAMLRDLGYGITET